MSLDSDDIDTLLRYADSLREGTRHDEAIAAYRQALAFGGAPGPIAFALAALGEGPEPPSAPADYVREHFDSFADGFDRHLTVFLRYRVPELLAAALAPLRPGRPIDTLDIGCGTGLCAQWLRPLARALVGIDLSERMLARAQERGEYDRLVCGDAVEVLLRHPGAFELVVAADVFVYIGDLEALFSAVHAALRPGGLFALSVEAGAADYALQSTLRYTHSRPYLQRLADTHGFVTRHLERHTLRQEAQIDVPGDIVVLQRA